MGSNIHGISCTANNYLKQARNDIKNEYEKIKHIQSRFLKTHWCVLCGYTMNSDVK